MSSTPASRPHALRRVGRADGHVVAAFRADVIEWLDDVFAISAERCADIMLATDEALSNCAEHAYRHHDAPGTMTLDVSHDDDTLRVCVSDRGVWTAPLNARPARGRGIRLMRGLSDEVTIDKQLDGSTVCLLFGDCALRESA